MRSAHTNLTEDLFALRLRARALVQYPQTMMLTARTRQVSQASASHFQHRHTITLYTRLAHAPPHALVPFKVAFFSPALLFVCTAHSDESRAVMKQRLSCFLTFDELRISLQNDDRKDISQVCSHLCRHMQPPSDRIILDVTCDFVSLK